MKSPHAVIGTAAVYGFKALNSLRIQRELIVVQARLIVNTTISDSFSFFIRGR